MNVSQLVAPVIAILGMATHVLVVRASNAAGVWYPYVWTYTHLTSLVLVVALAFRVLEQSQRGVGDAIKQELGL